MKRKQKFFWAEIAKHDTVDDCWVVIHGKVYNRTRFLKKHPGGLSIMEGAGGDCTELWESNHPTRLTKNGPPKSFLIGKVRDYKPFNSWKGDFYNDLKEKVEKEIPRERRRYSRFMIAHSITLVALYLVSLYLWIQGPSWKTMLLFCFIAG